MDPLGKGTIHCANAPITFKLGLLHCCRWWMVAKNMSGRKKQLRIRPFLQAVTSYCYTLDDFRAGLHTRVCESLDSRQLSG